MSVKNFSLVQTLPTATSVFFIFLSVSNAAADPAPVANLLQPAKKSLAPWEAESSASRAQHKGVVPAYRLEAKSSESDARARLSPVVYLPKGGVLAEQLKSSLLYVSDVKVSGNYRLTETQLRNLAGLHSAPGVWQVDIAQMRRSLLQSPWIEEVDISSTLYPASLKINIKEAELWFIAEYEQHSWLVSRKGRLIQALDTLDNPDIILETTELERLDGLNLQAGAENFLSSANARFLHAVNLMKLFESAGEFPFAVERYTLLPGGGMKLTPASASYPQVLLSAENLDEAVLRLKRLKSVLTDLERRSEKAHRIDLRFHNQAIVE